MGLKMPWQKNIWMASLVREIQLHLKWMKIILNLSENNKDSGHAAYFHV